MILSRKVCSIISREGILATLFHLYKVTPHCRYFTQIHIHLLLLMSDLAFRIKSLFYSIHMKSYNQVLSQNTVNPKNRINIAHFFIDMKDIMEEPKKIDEDDR